MAEYADRRRDVSPFLASALIVLLWLLRFSQYYSGLTIPSFFPSFLPYFSIAHHERQGSRRETSTATSDPQ